MEAPAVSAEHVCQDCGQLHLQVQTCLTCETALPDVAWWYHDGYQAGYQAGREWGEQVRDGVIHLTHQMLLQIDPGLPDTIDPDVKQQRERQREQILELRRMLADLKHGGQS